MEPEALTAVANGAVQANTGRIGAALTEDEKAVLMLYGQLDRSDQTGIDRMETLPGKQHHHSDFSRPFLHRHPAVKSGSNISLGTIVYWA